MKILFIGDCHHKIKKNMLNGFKLIDVQCDHISHLDLKKIKEYDIIYSPAIYIPIENYPNKKFVFGPQFSVFPNQIINNFDNKYKNAIYIHPSNWTIIMWKEEFNYKTLDIKIYPIGVDTDDFSPIENENKNEKKDNVMVYYKRRNLEELNFVLDYLKQKNIKFELIKYGSYNEKQFKECLNRSKCAIWVGSHESQGLALLETLSMNVPILVWNATKMNQEYPLLDQRYKHVKSIATTIPYWDDRCGEVFYEKNAFADAFDKMLIKQYRPREFILENFTLIKRAVEFINLCNSF